MCTRWPATGRSALKICPMESSSQPPQGNPPPPPQAPPQMSPDGRFWWNGTAWVPVQQPVAPGYPTVVLTPKSPGLHLLASFFIPGLGTILAGRMGRGIAILVAFIGLQILFFTLFFASFASAASSGAFNCTTPDVNITVNDIQSATHVCALSVLPWQAFALFPIFSLIMLGLWIFGLVDAYRSAQAWNRAHGILS